MSTILLIIWVHWIADFVAQTNWMAKGKSSSNLTLTAHIVAYSLFLLVFGPKYAVVNGVLHWITDYFSSRQTKKLWEKGDVHNFFVVIGLDQAIHLTTLLVTIPLMGW